MPESYYVAHILGVEKNNDDARKNIQRKTNHTDDPADILRAEHRIRLLKHRERRAHKYSKKATEYWESTIKVNRKRRKRLSYEKPPACEVAEDIPGTTTPAPKVPQTTGKRKKSTNRSKSNVQNKRAKK